MRIGQIFSNNERDRHYQVSYITDCLFIDGFGITERVISYHQVGHPHTTYAMLENAFLNKYSEQKQVSDE